MKLAPARRWWLTAHLYLGLFLGGFFVLLGLTGSLLVFYLEIDQMIAPVSVARATSTAELPLAHALRVLQQKFPDKKEGWRIELPRQVGEPIMARYMHPTVYSQAHFAPLIVKMDAKTHEISSARIWADFFVTWIYDLHYSLLLEDFGKTLVAVLGIFLLLSIFSGLYLWWPTSGNFKKALHIRPHAPWVRKIYDWHKLSGLVGFIFLFILAITGVMLAKPDWFKALLAQPAPLFEVPYLESQLGEQAITLDQAKKIAEQHFPQAKTRWIYTPDNANDVFQVRMAQTQEVGYRFPKTIVWIDQYSGEILFDRNATQDVAGDLVLQWLHPLHSGEAFGFIGRVLVFVSGLIPLMLFVTGVLRWRHKVRAKKK